MELLQLKYFKAVAESGKLSTAAEALFISAPALSASISRLEKELGTKLFDRTNNHLKLNKQGEIFLKRFQLEQTGLHPQYSFLMAEEKDVPVSYAEELDSIVLFEDRLVAMIHPDHPLAQKESLDIRLLEKETLCYPTPGLAMYERLSRLFEENNMPMPYGDTFPYLIYHRMAQEGMGISFTTQHISSLEPPANLRYVPIANANPCVFRLYWRKNRPLTDKELLFKDFVDGFYHPD